MRPFRLLGLAIVAAFVAASAFSTAAMALPEILPTSSSERTWTGKNDGTGKPELYLKGGAAGSQVVCASASATGTEEAGKPLGLFHMEFKTCSLGANVCTGLSDTAGSGTILLLGTWHLVWDELTPELNTARLFLFEEVHLSCGSTLMVIKSGGSLVCLDLEAMVSKASHLFHCDQNGGLPNDLHWWNGSGVEQTASLKCTASELITAECAWLWLGEVTYGVAVSADL
jgi:hypothetical protein